MTQNSTPHPCRLYLITPPVIDLSSFRHELAAALDADDVSAVQLRLKNADDDAICQAVEALLPICDSQGVSLILNDRPDLAKTTGCDGVHIGQEDTSYAKARDLLGPDAIIGVTCHNSRHLAIEAAETGAEYVAFGSFFPSKSKKTTAEADIETLEWWNEMMVVPCVAIGGITAENCAPLVKAGVDHICVISAVWDHPKGPGVAVKEFNRKFESLKA